MDVDLAIASKRDTRNYADEPLPAGAVERILDAGRLAGSARNRQPWRFLCVDDAAVRERLATAVHTPANVRGARLVVALVLPGSRGAFDAGRAAQNMMLAAWGEGIVSCPNGIADPEAARAALDLATGDEVATVISFGRPVTPRDPGRRSREEWSARADRKPLDALVERR